MLTKLLTQLSHLFMGRCNEWVGE